MLAVCLTAACTERTLGNSPEEDDPPALSTSDILENLGDSFRADARDSGGMPLWNASSVANFVYPDYYGGGYVDDEDHVVVFVKGKPEDFVDEFQQRAGSKDVIVLSCEYSYNEMVALVDSLNILFLDDALCDELGWTGIAIDTKKNRVLIDLLPLTERAKRRFRERICRSGAIEFGRGGVSISDASANLAGSVSYLKYGASIGYRAKNSKGASGFVTAGHLVPKVGGAIFINGRAHGMHAPSSFDETPTFAAVAYGGSAILSF